MIEKLSVRNWKSWADLPALEFGKVTALFGANSSGKTGLIQLLLMLKQTAASRDRRVLNFGGTERDYVDLGSYEDIVHSHKLNLDVSFSLTWVPLDHNDDWAEALQGKQGETTLKVVLSYLGEKVVVKQLLYDVEIGHERLYLDEDGEECFGIDYDESVNVSIELLPDGRYSMSPPSGTKIDSKDIEPLGFYAMQPLPYVPLGKNGEHLRRADSVFRDLARSVEKLLDSVYYLGPLREYPHREYRWSGERPPTVGVRGEYAVQAMLSKMVAEQSEELVESANRWLQHFGMADRIDLRPVAKGTRLYGLVVRARGYEHEANIMDVGFGVSQVLPIIVLSHFAPPGSLLILEQPEIHLHPQVQTELADLFLEIALKRNVQFLIESHSEYLLMRLQRRLAERQGEFAQLSEKDVKLYFCKREAEASVLEPLKVDEFGRIQNWPKDFFGDAVAERRAMAEAMIGRQSSK